MKLRIVLTIIAFIAGIFSGCSTLSSLTGGDRPSVNILGVKIQDWSLTKLQLLFDLDIRNPYALPLPLSNLKYALASEGTQFLSGDAKVQGTVPAHGSQTVPIPVDVTFAPLFQVLGKVKPGSVVPYQANMELSVDAPGVGPLALPISKTGELPIPAVPEVELTSIQWSELSLTKAAAKMNLKVRNTNDFPIDLTKFDFKLKLADTEVADNSITQATQFAKGQTNELPVDLSLSPMKLGLAFFKVLSGSGADYSISGAMDLKTPFGPLQLPLQRNGKTSFLR